MIDIYLQSLLAALQPTSLLFVFVGVLLGTLIGMLPGLGSIAGIAILLPLTYNMDPTSALVMLCGIYYGCEYGGSITSILLRTPGEGSTAISCLDGYQIARKGRPKLALATAAIASFVAGTTCAAALMLLTEPLSRIAIMLAPPEYFAITVMALVLTASFSGRSLFRGLAMMTLGLLIATVGMDAQTSVMRYTFEIPALIDGIPFIIAASGMFAVSELMVQANRGSRADAGRIKLEKGPWLSIRELWKILPSALRGSGIGLFIGMMPGAGSIAATVMSYTAERNLSKTPEKFGSGVLEGLSGPEAANNASAQGALLPLFTLGIPGSATGAVLLGAFMMYGLQPGPTLIANNPQMVWTIITSMFVGNMMLLVLNFPMVPIFAKILDLPRSILFGTVAVFVFTSVYSIRGEVVDLILLAGYGALGYILRRFDFPIPPILMGMVLGDILEKSLRRSLSLSLGDPMVFFNRPISGTIMAVTGLVLAYLIARTLYRRFSQGSSGTLS